MKFRHALLALLAFGVGFAGLADQADAQGFGRRAGRQGKMNADGARGARIGLRGGQQAGPFAALELTEDQQAKLQELRETHRAQMAELRASGTRPTAEEIQQIREEHRAQFEAILTSEQLAQLEQLRANCPQGQEGTTDAASKPTGAAVQSSSWSEVKEQMK